VEFDDGTTIDQITAGLKAVPASDVTNEEGTWFFSANWGTSQKDLNNLKGRIETRSGRNSVTGIGLQGDDKSATSASSSGDEA